jgi:predicted DNA-binding antitoxin AbrB/MazE fold protein
MTRFIEAIYSNGVLKPVDALDLTEQQRVRLILHTVDSNGSHDREAALKRLREGIAKMDFSSTGPLPSRDELHDRA